MCSSDLLATEAAPANRSIAVFYAHGTHDAVIPIALAQASREALQAAGYAVEWHDYPMQHSVCVEEIGDISRWLSRALG